MDQFLKSLLITVAVAFIAPAVIQIVRLILGTGSFTLAAILNPIKKLFIGLVKIGKFIIIPIASIILFAPDSMRSAFPSSSTILGVCVLIVASIYLLYAMFGGLRQALAISFWACICIVVVSAFQLDKWLPQPEKKPVRQLGELLVQAEKQVGTIPDSIKDKQVRKVEDGLEVTSFSLQKNNSVPQVERSATESLTATAERHYSSIEQQVSSYLSPSVSWVFGSGGKDQSFKGLPSEMYFEGKNKKKQRYGFTDPNDSDSSNPISDFVTNFFKD